MFVKQDKNKARVKRHMRVRNHISGTPERPRLNVFRSLSNIYAQVIDDVNGVTLVSANSQEKDFVPTAETSRQQRKSANSSPSAPLKRALKKSCLIAAATSTTVVLRPWPRLPVKPA